MPSTFRTRTHKKYYPPSKSDMNFMDVDELVEYILSGEYLYRKPRELSFKQRLAKFVSYIKSFVKTRNVDDLYAAWRI